MAVVASWLARRFDWRTVLFYMRSPWDCAKTVPSWLNKQLNTLERVDNDDDVYSPLAASAFLTQMLERFVGVIVFNQQPKRIEIQKIRLQNNCYNR